MGKKYFCEYCDKSMVATPATIKTHNNGTSHQKNRKEHYLRYRDPKTILEEECSKKPCHRWFSGAGCPFGAICRYTHYSPEQLDELRSMVQNDVSQASVTQDKLQSLQSLYARIETNRAARQDNTPALGDTSILTHEGKALAVLPWSYPNDLVPMQAVLPPSMRMMEANAFANCKINNLEWG